MITNNEERADLGQRAVMEVAVETNVAAVEPATTSVLDVLAYIAHFCNRLGLDAEETFATALRTYESDFEDGPRADHKLHAEVPLVDQLAP